MYFQEKSPNLVELSFSLSELWAKKPQGWCRTPPPGRIGLNKSLRTFCVDNDMTYVDNTNIGVEALQKGRLHLNSTGTIHLGMNFKQCMKSFLALKAGASDDKY